MTKRFPRALVVEDDPSWQQLLAEILTDCGLEVDIADNLKDAVASLRTHDHRLAVVDLSLSSGDHSNKDGLAFLDAVRRHDPGCVTILLTGYATVEVAVSSLTEYGAFSCLRKERFNRADFRDVVRQAQASPRPGGTDEAGVAMVQEGRALIVEDDAGWRSILAELLADAGYEVRLCNSYGEALGCLRREEYGLAVVDLSLEGPGQPAISGADRHSAQTTDGYRLLATTRQRAIPTIVVSGVATTSDIDSAYAEQQVFACLEKQTFNRQAFLRTVAEARDSAGAGGELDHLTPRERDVLGLVSRGYTNKEIATELVITTNTVKRHLKAVFSKLEVHNRSAAAAKAVQAGMPTSHDG